MKGEIILKEDRLIEIANILETNLISIGKYDFENPLDIIYRFMWLEGQFLYYEMNALDIVHIIRIYKKRYR